MPRGRHDSAGNVGYNLMLCKNLANPVQRACAMLFARFAA
jgi:hypothetical protein